MKKLEQLITGLVVAGFAVILWQGVQLWAQTGIGTKQIKDGAITSPKLAAGAVTPDKLDESYYTETEIDSLLDDKVDSDSSVYTGLVEHQTTLDALTGLITGDGMGGYSGVTDNSSNWDDAYGWGDHAGLYDDIGTGTAIIQSHEGLYSHVNYDTAYGWGNHAGLYSLLAHTHVLGEITDYDTPLAEDIRTDTSNFNGNLSNTDTTVQAALETLDELAGGGDMLKATYDLDDSGKVDTAEDLAVPSQTAGDVLYFDGGRWNRLAKDEGKYLKSGASDVSWDTPAGGAGDMTKAVYDLDDSGMVDTAEDLSVPSQTAGDILYFDGDRWNRLAKDAGKYLKSGDSAPAWDTPAGSGDMTKAEYDLNEDSRVDTAEVLSDGTYTSSAQDVKDAVDKKHTQKHNIDGTDDHNGVSGATENNFISFDASGLPKDSGKKDSDYADASHTHTASDVTDINTQINQVYKQVLSVATSTETNIFLYDGARVSFYDITASGDTQADTVILNDGKFPMDGDNLIIRFKASSAAYTLTLLESGDDTFQYGASVTSSDLTQTETDKTDLIGCQWFDTLKKWIVLAISKGF
jgi:hypothetical protein